jgi:hypothetical protein
MAPCHWTTARKYQVVQWLAGATPRRQVSSHCGRAATPGSSPPPCSKIQSCHALTIQTLAPLLKGDIVCWCIAKGLTITQC